MNQKDLKKASRIIKSAELEGIRLVEGSMRSQLRNVGEVGAVTFDLDYSARATDRLDDGFFALARYKISVVPAEDNQAKVKPVVEIKALFELRYSLPADLETTKADLTAFARLNSAFNAWPYFREFTHSSLRRMELPAIVLPLFRLKDLIAEKPEPNQAN